MSSFFMDFKLQRSSEIHKFHGQAPNSINQFHGHTAASRAIIVQFFRGTRKSFPRTATKLI